MSRMMLIAALVVLASMCALVRAAPGDLIAMHQLVVVPPTGDVLIRMLGYNKGKASPKLTYNAKTTPATGNLYQLSQVFSAYGYEPKKGSPVKVDDLVTGSNSRVFYKRPSPDVSGINKWGTFTYTTSAGSGDSPTGTVTLVPPSGALVGSDFLLDAQGWAITGNKAAIQPASYEAYSRGPLLNHYVYGTDNKINVGSRDSGDKSLWYFEAPSSYLGNHGIAYGGSISFTLGAFSGDFSKPNAASTHLLEIECKLCPGPVSMGVRLAFPISAYAGADSYAGDSMRFTVPLLEGKGWLKDSQNTMTPWTAASKCDVIAVLSRLSALRILGDWTTWYESVALDDVQIANTRGQLPLCAMATNDASVCTC